MPAEPPRREQGIEFESFGEDLERLAYPLSGADIVERCGGREVDVRRATQTVRELFAPIDDATFRSPAEVREALFSMVAIDAVGRARYSDRGGASPADQAGRSADSF